MAPYAMLQSSRHIGAGSWVGIEGWRARKAAGPSSAKSAMVCSSQFLQENGPAGCSPRAKPVANERRLMRRVEVALAFRTVQNMDCIKTYKVKHSTIVMCCTERVASSPSRSHLQSISDERFVRKSAGP
jgi:hypothetical protein